MPTVFRKNGYRFFFYSNDHSPIHVHVTIADGEAVFNVQDEVVLRESYGLNTKQVLKAQTLAEEHRKQIIDAWHAYFA